MKLKGSVELVGFEGSLQYVPWQRASLKYSTVVHITSQALGVIAKLILLTQRALSFCSCSEDGNYTWTEQLHNVSTPFAYHYWAL